jgi:hypothetical protein
MKRQEIGDRCRLCAQHLFWENGNSCRPLKRNKRRPSINVDLRSDVIPRAPVARRRGSRLRADELREAKVRDPRVSSRGGWPRARACEVRIGIKACATVQRKNRRVPQSAKQLHVPCVVLALEGIALTATCAPVGTCRAEQTPAEPPWPVRG